MNGVINEIQMNGELKTSECSPSADKIVTTELIGFFALVVLCSLSLSCSKGEIGNSNPSGNRKHKGDPLAGLLEKYPGSQEWPIGLVTTVLEARRTFVENNVVAVADGTLWDLDERKGKSIAIFNSPLDRLVLEITKAQQEELLKAGRQSRWLVAAKVTSVKRHEKPESDELVGEGLCLEIRQIKLE